MMGLGLIRLLLAFSVVVTHSSPVFGYNVANGVVAVRTFFIISGFFIALILDKKYKSIRIFYRNRALRIYPLYLLVLLLTVLFALFAHNVKGVWGELEYWAINAKQMSLATWLEVVGANLSIFGRNAIMFSGFNNITGNLFFKPDFNYLSQAYNFLLIPQAWAIVMELQFYLIAPFLAKTKNYLLVLLIILSLMSRYFMSIFGFTHIYWTNRFLLNELVFFLVGILSYRLYLIVKKFSSNFFGMPRVATLVIISFLLIFNLVPGNLGFKSAMFYILFTILLPFVFIHSKNVKVDRILGDLSYPIYLVHILLITIIYPSVFNTYVSNKNLLAPVVMLMSIIFSLLINAFIQPVIEKMRAKGT